MGHVEVLHGVGDVGLELLCQICIRLNFSLHIVVEVLPEALAAVHGQLAQLVSKSVHELQVTHADPVADGLGGVGWSNAALGGADLLASARQLCLTQAINLLMQVKQQVGPVRDEQAPLDLHPPGLQGLDLAEHAWQVHHHAVANHAYCVRVKDAGGHKVQRVLVALGVVDGVPGVCPTLGTRNNLVLSSQDVHELALALISPLSTQHHSHLCIQLLLCHWRCCSWLLGHRPRQVGMGTQKVGRSAPGGAWPASRLPARDSPSGHPIVHLHF
mmetsp:Transcript_10587/g.28988  ORF Transcript_10587/g.28988 Transcript_10587/m.28988 type:complete len:272 (-) Transcript_10587:61-876(-)